MTALSWDLGSRPTNHSWKQSSKQKRRLVYCHEFMRACNFWGGGEFLLKLYRHPNRSRFISHQNCDDNAHYLTVLMWQIVTSM